MNRWIAGGLFVIATATASCTRSVRIPKLAAGSDYSGLSHQYTDSEVHGFEWAAIDAAVPADVARSIRRWQLNNLNLLIFRCDDPKDYFPAYATLNGQLFEYEALKEPLPLSVKLTFYLPKHVQARGRYDCAQLDARGYSPVFLQGQVMRLPALRYVSIGTSDSAGRPRLVHLSQRELEEISSRCHTPPQWLRYSSDGQLHVVASTTAKYRQVDCVLTALKLRGAARIGFIGNMRSG